MQKKVEQTEREQAAEHKVGRGGSSHSFNSAPAVVPWAARSAILLSRA